MREFQNVDNVVKTIWYWRSHIDKFISDVLSHPKKPIVLMPFQNVIVRSVGNNKYIIDVECRSLGKTFKMALVLLSIGILYPESKILIVSKTYRQSVFTLKYIENMAKSNPNIAREIDGSIKTGKDEASCRLKNGSIIEAMAVNVDGSNLRGLRDKVIYIDESGWVKTDVITSVLSPIIQYKRDIYWKYKDEGFEDYPSKIVQTSSAYLKSSEFYSRFKMSLLEMKKGTEGHFSFAINYKTGVRYGIIDEKFVEAQKQQMALSSWEMEWNSRFIGNTEMSYFSYALTEPCRTLERIELVMPKGSKSRYIISCDIATSASNRADNACMMVIKFSERLDYSYNKEVVFIRSFHGKRLDELAKELRILCIKFPNTEKLIIDINAIGEGIVSLLNKPYVDVDTNKEYPPFCLDDDNNKNNTSALPIIRGIKANNMYNNRMATATRLFFENMSLAIPITSALMRREFDSSNNELAMQEIAVFIEADSLQYELGNIIPKLTASGNVIYETSNPRLHKDRYSCLGMGLEYIYILEQKNRENYFLNDDFCIGSSYSM